MDEPVRLLTALHIGDGRLSKILPAIVPHRARWEHLNFRPDKHSPALINGPMDLLQHIDMQLATGSTVFDSGDVPQLRSVVLDYHAVMHLALHFPTNKNIAIDPQTTAHSSSALVLRAGTDAQLSKLVSTYVFSSGRKSCVPCIGLDILRNPGSPILLSTRTVNGALNVDQGSIAPTPPRLGFAQAVPRCQGFRPLHAAGVCPTRLLIPPLAPRRSPSPVDLLRATAIFFVRSACSLRAGLSTKTRPKLAIAASLTPTSTLFPAQIFLPPVPVSCCSCTCTFLGQRDTLRARSAGLAQ
ncbi:hypothetical protein K438DRAFT_1973742 [Mycena galopus ATCC 62051]|nr:hypothetical protein K438DRAFT_1973742 [Mycena galopus ATCC 62051]